MRKLKLTLTVIVTLTLLSFTTMAQTTVSGGIYANTTWTLANSPYIVTDTVVLFQGLTLTIQPGVVVKMANNVMIEIRGTLHAIGTHSDSIKFTSLSGNPVTNNWEGILINTNLGGNAAIKFCVIEYAHTALSVECCGNGGPVTMSASSFKNNGVALGGYAGWDELVDSCSFSNNTMAIIQADKTITNSVFTDNLYGLYQTERIDVYDSKFCGNQTALYGGRGNLQSCSIMNNGIGVNSFYEGFYNVSGNVIAKNDTGIVMGMYDYTSPGLDGGNTICGNYVYNIVNGTPLNINVPNNCWCETDPTIISQKVYDGYDNISLGLVNYTPYSSCDASAIPLSACEDVTTGISQPALTGTLDITIFPNPFTSQASIIFSEEQKNTIIKITDLLGKEIRTVSFTGKQFTIDKGEMSKGIYIVQVTDEHKNVVNKKIIVQ